MIINPYIYGGASLLLDTYPSATAAYSLRKLRNAYSGNAIRVRRSSDNTEQNIGFVNNVLDTASLLTFCGVGNGFVTTWYDQSGNANNGTQATAANQPQIVSSGAMITTNGKNSMLFDGTNDFFSLASLINVASSNYNSFVGKRDAASRMLYGLSRDEQHYFWGLFNDNFYSLTGSKLSLSQRSNAADTTTSQLLLTGLNSAGTMSIYNNSVVIPSTESALARPQTINVIGKYWFGFFIQGNLQEIVYYNIDQLSNKTGIETNINTFYSIY